MKPFLTGIFAVILAIGAVAFTNVESAKAKGNFTDYYFNTDGSGNPQATSALYTSLQSGWGCTSTVNICAKSYTSFTGPDENGLYHASGSVVNSYFKP